MADEEQTAYVSNRRLPADNCSFVCEESGRLYGKSGEIARRESCLADESDQLCKYNYTFVTGANLRTNSNSTSHDCQTLLTFLLKLKWIECWP